MDNSDTLPHELCNQMLANKWMMVKTEAVSATWVIQAEANVEYELVSCDRVCGRMCHTMEVCMCGPIPL